jgi:ABC-type branched-subunit amino acid transport system substrate-binding protein
MSERMESQMRNISRRTLVKGSLAAIVTGAAMSRAALAQSSEPIMLGVSGPLTGPNAQYGAQWKQGFDLALDEIHAAGGEAMVNGAAVLISGEPSSRQKLKASSV